MKQQIKKLFKPDTYTIERMLTLLSGSGFLFGCFQSILYDALLLSLLFMVLAFVQYYRLLKHERYLPVKRYNINAIGVHSESLSILFKPLDRQMKTFEVQLVSKNFKKEFVNELVHIDKEVSQIQPKAINTNPRLKVEANFAYVLSRHKKNRLLKIFDQHQHHFNIFNQEYLQWQLDRMHSSHWYQLTNRASDFIPPDDESSKRLSGMVKQDFVDLEQAVPEASSG